jgi:hypothetical protein
MPMHLPIHMAMRVPIHVPQAYPRPRSRTARLPIHIPHACPYTYLHTCLHACPYMSVRMPQATCSVSSSRPHCSRTASRRRPAPRPVRPSAFDHFSLFPMHACREAAGSPVTRVQREAPTGPPFDHFFTSPGPPLRCISEHADGECRGGSGPLWFSKRHRLAGQL